MMITGLLEHLLKLVSWNVQNAHWLIADTMLSLCEQKTTNPLHINNVSVYISTFKIISILYKMKPLFHIDTLYHQYFYTNNAEFVANDCYKKCTFY